jgi:hypothetical protein
LITQIIFGEECKFWSSSLCILLQFLPFRSKYSLHHPSIKHPPSVFFP